MSKLACTEKVSHTKIKVEENQRKATFLNPDSKEFKITLVDGCVIPRGETAADYLIVKESVASVFIELKGTDVSHACDQLFATVEDMRIKNLIKGKIGFLVICSRYPRFDSYVARAKTKAARKYKAGFHVVVNKGEFNIERCAAIDGPT